MLGYFFDLALVALFIIGTTAFLGDITNSIGNKLFSKNNNANFVDQSNNVQTGWKSVGGK